MGLGPAQSLRAMFLLYAALGLCVLLLFTHLGPAVELSVEERTAALSRTGRYGARPGLGASRGTVRRLAGLFGLASLAGGVRGESLLALCARLRWGGGPEVLGPVFLGVGLLQAGSFLAA